jgi:hypothetical protein
MNERKFMEGLTALLSKCFGSDADDAPRHEETDKIKEGISVSKSVDEELKQATFLVLSPDEVDLHGDIYDADEVRKACHNFQTHCRKANLFHEVQTNLAFIAESYIAPADFYLEETFVRKGSWLQVWQIQDDELWSGIKSGEINGVSIGCTATYEELEDEG